MGCVGAGGVGMWGVGVSIAEDDIDDRQEVEQSRQREIEDADFADSAVAGRECWIGVWQKVGNAADLVEDVIFPSDED